MVSAILWFLVTLGILVTFHEFGHFYIARRCGVKVLRFSVGFGKSLFCWRDRHGTEFVVAAIPLGGYVKMLDEREGEVKPDELPQAFTQKSVAQRMAIVSAGPLANFILAAVVYFALALVGSKGIAPVTGALIDGSPADRAGIGINEEIVSVDGESTPTWAAVIGQLVSRIGDTGDLVFMVRSFHPIGDRSDLALPKIIPVRQWLGDADRPDLLAELGIIPAEPETTWTIIQIASDSAAEQAGLQIGDQLIAVDGAPLESIKAWRDYIRQRAEIPLEMVYRRDGVMKQVRLIPKLNQEDGLPIGKAGIGIDLQWPQGMVRDIQYSLPAAAAHGLTKTLDQAVLIFSFLKRLILLDLSVKNMGGTITIAQVASDTAQSGWINYLGFLAFLSVSLGVFNLLPIPVLDGGHLLFYTIEAIRGRPLSEKLQLVGYQIGLFVIVSVMIVAHYNDLVRLFS